MKHKIYFLISPKLWFVEKIREAGSESLSDLTKPVLWSGDESDRSALLHSDMDSLVKLIFVETLQRERSGGAAFWRVFENVRVATEFFDNYWSLVRIPLDMSVEDALEDSLQGGNFGSLLPTGNSRLDAVLAEYQIRSTRDL